MTGVDYAMRFPDYKMNIMYKYMYFFLCVCVYNQTQNKGTGSERN